MGVFSSFYYGGTSSLKFNMRIEKKFVLGGAEADMDEYEVPGRDGTVFVSNKRRRNIEIGYDTYLKVPAAIDLPRYTGDIKRWLLSKPGEYLRLEDSYDMDHFRLAVYAGGLEFNEFSRRVTRQTINFSCLPYRFRKTGETELDAGQGLELSNFTGYDALPLIRLTFLKGNLAPEALIKIEYEDGTSYEETLKDLGEEQNAATLDCDRRIIYDSSGRPIAYNTLYDFPVLKPGLNKVIIRGERVTGAFITPRWREL